MILTGGAKKSNEHSVNDIIMGKLVI